MIQHNKPNIRELTLKNGISYPSDEELLMLILNKGTKKSPIEKLASEVLSVMNSSNAEKLIEQLEKIDGIGQTKALAVAAAIELGRRRNCYLNANINAPKDILPYIQHYAIETKEHFICASLNGAREIMHIRVVFVGTINRTIVHPREIFAEPVAEHASAVICCHNHPSGSCNPSVADKQATRTLQEAANVLGITFLDHIIITRDSYYSFLEHGLLSEA